jgi:hypothetical protein
MHIGSSFCISQTKSLIEADEVLTQCEDIKFARRLT